MEEYYSIRNTDRLRIRPLKHGDIRVWESFIMDKTATHYFPDEMKLDPEKAKIWIEGQLKRYKENRYGLMALTDINSGQLIGQCGLLTQVVDEVSELEIGYHLLPQYWGHGYASEAAKDFKKFAFNNKLSDSIISIIHVDNVRSQNVAARNGMKQSKKTRWRDSDVFIYRIQQPVG